MCDGEKTARYIGLDSREREGSPLRDREEVSLSDGSHEQGDVKAMVATVGEVLQCFRFDAFPRLLEYM